MQETLSLILPTILPSHSSGVARMSKLRGDSMGTFSARVAAFGHKYHSFSLTCKLASRPHEAITNWSLTIAIDFTRPPVNLRGHRPAQACAHIATHIQCMHNRGTGTPSRHEIVFEIIHSEITSEAVLAANTILSVLPVSSLHVHMKVITHANNWSLTLAFHIIFTWTPVNLRGHRPGYVRV